MSKLAIVMVEGDNATVQEALKAGIAMIENVRANGWPAVHALPAGDGAEVQQLASRISKGTVKRAVAKVRKAAMHGGADAQDDIRPAKPARKRLPCGMNGCLETFGSYYTRGKHWGSAHGKVN